MQWNEYCSSAINFTLSQLIHTLQVQSDCERA